MRTEQEMFQLILQVAANDERIRAVGMNGSRTNPNVPKDIFQDYDIVYLVTDMASLLTDHDWINVFGERIIIQMPDATHNIAVDSIERFAYLMLFMDGNRIDLTLIPIEKRYEYCEEDTLTTILLDKDNSMPSLPSPTDKDYHVKPPTEIEFLNCCNEFWWVSTYIAKGLWRREILYAFDHLNFYVRPMLLKMLSWQVGIDTNFTISIGKNGKYLKSFLTNEQWKKLLCTYPDGNDENIWNSLFQMFQLFRSTAQYVAGNFNFSYNFSEDKRVTDYVHYVQKLGYENLNPAFLQVENNNNS
ncbi:aminoglycoside 6-adenylyltransferase [Caldibacillus lycopersici]|uniref:Aminoglycoside 6-adenylyltransferase n=1 Tax=Perspicuibacillus lycopersici TaxID=1325689 RepID=A0AAE3IW96_9BACI|nr:aminoglycoside 6-adenylyltransferase [Perspicuibacillus lycopersici]MCU9614763.1 aminoglycoside 6-adenylyltransferase [Perspicuibacillus lycopersici]